MPIFPSSDLHWTQTQAVAMKIRRLTTSSLLVLNRVQDIYQAVTEIGLISFLETANKLEDEIVTHKLKYEI
jgi:hypothetical protein